tara:strand:+ start:4113 stop:4535 length:423 start_codon:yes stop_codon:yes gene_type:complete
MQVDAVEMVSQREILIELGHLGYHVSGRTLTEWRSLGKVPPLVRIGNEYRCAKRPTIEQALIAASSNGHINNGFRFGKQPDILFVHRVEGREFDIVRVEVVRVSGSARLILHTSGEEFFLLAIQEEELNALTRNHQDHHS